MLQSTSSPLPLPLTGAPPRYPSFHSLPEHDRQEMIMIHVTDVR